MDNLATLQKARDIYVAKGGMRGVFYGNDLVCLVGSLAAAVHGVDADNLSMQSCNPYGASIQPKVVKLCELLAFTQTNELTIIDHACFFNNVSEKDAIVSRFDEAINKLKH